jgi:hypothetical protein
MVTWFRFIGAISLLLQLAGNAWVIRASTEKDKTTKQFKELQNMPNDASDQPIVPRSDSDPRQCIYDAMNWMGGSVSSEPPHDSDDVIEAYEHALRMSDKQAQEAIIVVVQKLRARNESLQRIAKAWRGSSERLRQACQMITNERG